MIDSRFVDYWRAANRRLMQRRRPGLNAGRAWMYWLCGFSPEMAADAETFRGRV